MRFSPRSGFSSPRRTGGSPRRVGHGYRGPGRRYPGRRYPWYYRRYGGYYGPGGWFDYTYPYTYVYGYPPIYVKDENPQPPIYVPCASAGQTFKKDEVICCSNLDTVCINKNCSCQTRPPK